MSESSNDQDNISKKPKIKKAHKARVTHDTNLEIIRSLNSTSKLFSLYRMNHPVSLDALWKTYQLLDKYLVVRKDKMILALVHKQWLINSVPVNEPVMITQALRSFFSDYYLHSLAFMPGLEMTELGAFFELTTGNPTEENLDLADLFRQKDIRHIEFNIVFYSPFDSQDDADTAKSLTKDDDDKNEEVPPGVPLAEEIADLKPENILKIDDEERSADDPDIPPSGPGTQAKEDDLIKTGADTERSNGASCNGQEACDTANAQDLSPDDPKGRTKENDQEPANASSGERAKKRSASFSSFFRALVEKGVKDPNERTMIYAQTVDMIKNAISDRTAEATRQAAKETQLLGNEQIRTARVLTAIAAGKVTVDKNGKVLMINPAAEEMVGKKLIDIAGKSLTESLDEEGQMVVLAPDIETPEDPKRAPNVRVVAKQEVERVIKQSTALVHNEIGGVVGTYMALPHVSQLKKTLKIQDEIMARVSHELRAPLTSIFSALEILNDKAGSKLDKDESQFLSISLQNTNKLKHLVDDIVNFSKVKSGKMSIAAVPTDIEPILKEAAEGMNPWAHTKKLNLDIADIARDIPQISADHARTVQVLTNLISNAIKHTKSGGQISIKAELGTDQKQDCAVFSVRDTGIGISKENLKKIFHEFVQLNPSSLRNAGTGLGLVIAKELIQLQGGRIWAESEEGQGSTFYFTLPLIKDTDNGSPEEVEQASKPKTPWNEKLLRIFANKSSSESA
ncbi:ATP-binding protein [Elusimicrobiota bacterium]